MLVGAFSALRRHSGSKPELLSTDSRWFSAPGLQNGRRQKRAPKTHPKRTPKRTVFGPQKRKRAHKSPPAPGSADLIPSRDAVRTGQPPGKPMRHSWVCPGVGALGFHGPGPHPLKNTSRNPQEPPGAHFRQPVADRRGRNRVLLQRPTLRTSCLNIQAVWKF